MAAILEQIRLWVEQMVQMMGYFGIALLMFLENIFPPIPSEVIMPFAGSLVSSGELSFYKALIAGTIGALAGAIAIYYIGIVLPQRRVRRWFEKYGNFLLMSEKDFDRTMDTFNNHGTVMVLVGRVMPAVRSLISLPAGLDEMPLAKFLLYTTIGTSIWNIMLLGAGVLMGNNWRRILNIVNTYELVFWLISGGLVLYAIYKRTLGQPQEEQPHP